LLVKNAPVWSKDSVLTAKKAAPPEKISSVRYALVLFTKAFAYASSVLNSLVRQPSQAQLATATAAI
jgi:hypothetical protein